MTTGIVAVMTVVTAGIATTTAVTAVTAVTTHPDVIPQRETRRHGVRLLPTPHPRYVG